VFSKTRSIRVKDPLERHETERKRKRSVSPEPVYGPDGARVNTKEKRDAEKLAAKRAECLRFDQKALPVVYFPGVVRHASGNAQDFHPTRETPGVQLLRAHHRP
jgi:hypothetical protein